MTWGKVGNKNLVKRFIQIGPFTRFYRLSPRFSKVVNFHVTINGKEDRIDTIELFSNSPCFLVGS